MWKLHIIAIATLILTGGCRSIGDPYPAESATGRHSQAGASVAAHSLNGNQAGEPSGVSLLEKAKVHGEREKTQHTTLRPVAYLASQDAVDSPQPESIPSPLTDESPTSILTLADLEGMALQSNPVLAQASAHVEAAQGNWVQVGLAPNPHLGDSGQQLGSHGQAEQQGVFIGQEFVIGKKLRLSRQAAAWEVDRAEQELEAARLRVLTDVRIGYYDVLIAQRRRDLTAELVRVGDQGAKVAQSLFEGEEVSKADPLRARVEADSARILLQNSINQHMETWRRLAAVIGMPQLSMQRLTGELNPEAIGMSWQDELRRVLSNSPEIAAAVADVEAAEWAVERARAEVIPNLDVQAIIQDDRGTGSSNGNLQVTMPIPIWNRNQGGIRRAEAEAMAAEKAVDRVALDLQLRLAAAFQRNESARNQVEQYSKKGGIIDNATQTLELIRKGYQAEEFGVLDLLTAQSTYFRTNLAYLDALRSLWVSIMEIRGLMLRDSLQ